MKFKLSFLFFLTITSINICFSISYAGKYQNVKVVESTADKIKLEFEFSGRFVVADTVINGKSFNLIKGIDPKSGWEFTDFLETGKPWLPLQPVNIGIPFDSKPSIKIISDNREIINNKFIIPVPRQDTASGKLTMDIFDSGVYGRNIPFPVQPASLTESFFMRYIRVASLSVSPFQFNPVTRELIFHKKIVLEITFNVPAGAGGNNLSVSDPMTLQFVKSNIINAPIAEKWIGKKNKNLQKPFQKQTGSDVYWYNPNKDYYKLYLNTKGIYRVTFEYLRNAGVPLNNIPVNNLALYNLGELIPLSVTDSDSNNIFGEGDYFEFIGTPVKPTPYTTINIYNNSNVYWFSYQGDSLSGSFYSSKSGFPDNWQYVSQTSLKTDHYEKDSIYERLGYAQDDKRDYWFWGRATAQSGAITERFIQKFEGFTNLVPDSHYVTIRVNLHGMTDNGSCPIDHDAFISVNGKRIGEIQWDGQTAITFEKKFYTSQDSVPIYPHDNIILVEVNGNTCPPDYSDEIRINWFDLDYWRFNRASTTYSFLSDSGLTGKIDFWVWQWQDDSVKIFVPQKKQMITNYAFDETYQGTVFVDSITEQTEYFLIQNNIVPPLPDSIKKDVPSDYRNLTNGADYIIITHPDFMDAANKLAQFRKNNFPDSSIANPRIIIADVFQIYDEFSYGLLTPFALQDFIKYAFDNWQQPAPSYVVLLGDMSWDYRHLLSSSRPNFVPSIPVHVNELPSLVYGQAVSDNRMVAVHGDDNIPDLAIGRLSCENIDEANILLNKIITYPQDNSKEWKQNVLLVASGQTESDEEFNGFNDASTTLERSSIAPLGIKTTKVFRYPNKPEYLQYLGDTPQVRQGFDDGAVIVNYYGHGGGSQWDFIFLNDDIFLLNNGGRLPFIASTTCYTAHFDNQDVFGEKFVKVPGKGAIGFIGSSGLTLWDAGRYFNELMYDQIFNHSVYNIGKAIFFASGKFPMGPTYESQLALFTYLGDPVLQLALPDKPDFQVNSGDISIYPQAPLINDTVFVKVKIQNLGTVFSDSVTVQLFATSPDTSYQVGTFKRGNFGELDSLSFLWIPKSSSLYELSARVNEINEIPENDHSDNIASASFAVFNLTEPNILSPDRGYSTKLKNVDFVFSDIGYYAGKNLTYTIEIDTSLIFASPLFKSGAISPADGLLKWRSPVLTNGEYFWRARIYDGSNYGNWSSVRGFVITDTLQKKYSISGKLLNLYSTYNINYSPEKSALLLNSDLLPPKPDQSRFIEDIKFPTTGIDNLGLTTITTDGKYIYFANIWYYSLNNNPQGYTKIHKVGTGYNGTVKGQYYGTIPSFENKILYQMFYHSDGFIYAATGDPHTLFKIDPGSGDTSTVFLPAGMLENESGKVQSGAFYIISDGKYVYNLTVRDSLGNNKYVLRTFDPASNWALSKPDVILSGTSYYGTFSGFFVADGYVYPMENYSSNYIRRINLNNGIYEQEWVLNIPYQAYYALSYDWSHNEVYASVYKGGLEPKFSKFAGKYTDASGTITSEDIGPAVNWKNLSYNIQNGSPRAKYSAVLKGLNKSTRNWDVLSISVTPSFALNFFAAAEYPYLRLEFTLTDTSTGNSNPLQLNKVDVDYDTPPEIVLTKKDISFSPDTLLQGLSTIMNVNVRNIGNSDSDSLQVKFYLNAADSAFYSTKMKVLKDSSTSVSYTIQTRPIIFQNSVKVIAASSLTEYFTYNNIAEQTFFVARDSIKPEYKITFDGAEIINGDIVSAAPEVLITLKDNSPLPLDTSFFTIVFDDSILKFSGKDIQYTYTGYPNSELDIKWKPKLADGIHTLDVLAKDASNNFFDSTFARTEFSVYNVNALENVFNFPNPFKDNTYFTFELRGTEVPEQLSIKIYTIAGRLIRDIVLPTGLKIGFNKIMWDGRDQDGDVVANGLYLYKVISKYSGKSLTSTQKLVKMK